MAKRFFQRKINVAWRLKEDENWYGANVPDSLMGVEKIRVDSNDYITPQRASVMP